MPKINTITDPGSMKPGVVDRLDIKGALAMLQISSDDFKERHTTNVQNLK